MIKTGIWWLWRLNFVYYKLESKKISMLSQKVIYIFRFVRIKLKLIIETSRFSGFVHGQEHWKGASFIEYVLYIPSTFRSDSMGGELRISGLQWHISPFDTVCEWRQSWNKSKSRPRQSIETTLLKQLLTKSDTKHAVDWPTFIPKTSL